MKLQTVDELQAMALDHAEYMLLGEADTQLAPTWWIQFDNKRGEMIVTPWDDDAEKLAVVEMIKNKLKDRHAHSYAFASEVWVAAENAKRPTQLPPSQHPDRREALMVHVFNRNGKGGARVYDIKRNDDGVIFALPEDKDANLFQGRMFNLFRDERMQHSTVHRGKTKFDAATTRTPLNHCLDCGSAIDAGTPADPNDPSIPSPGDIAICLHCAHVMLYADDLTVRALTDAEVVEVAGDPDMVRAVNAIAKLNKAERRA
jgi:hypothetical protein